MVSLMLSDMGLMLDISFKTASHDEDDDLFVDVDVDVDSSVLLPSVVKVLRKLRDHNPSLQRKLSHGIASSTDTDTATATDQEGPDHSLSYWNRYKQSPMVIMDQDNNNFIGINFGGLMVRLVNVIPFLQALDEEKIDLHTINLGGTDIGMDNLYEGIQNLSVELRMSWKKLYLGGCGISCRKGMDDFMNVLKLCPNVETLDLRYNDFTGEDMEKFKSQLSWNECKVSILHLEGNVVKCDGAASVGSILSQTKDLKELYLGGNRIGVEGAKALANGLNENSSVVKIYLEANLIGDEGANAFSEVLLDQNERQCKVLEKLYFENNGIGKDAATKLGGAVNSAGLIGGSLFD
mmetsp:Transcript_7803/g.11723  ORF Transcript_7803/g.11723 Transcript_7803/m.11723 type:complete len:350 (-) Transcript_7803:8-1057(-)